MGFRRNVAPVEPLSVKDTWDRDVAQIRQKDVSESQRQGLDQDA